MIHHWGSEFIVRPRATTVVESSGTYNENYYSVQPPKSIVMNPITYLNGSKSSAKYTVALICLPGACCDIGGTIYLSGKKSSAELSTRAVNRGGTVIQKGMLVGATEDVQAHVDCSGLMLSDTGIIEAVPGLRAMHPDAKMSHEAAIGKIDANAVNYLQSKGFSEAQAISLIVSGFLKINDTIGGLDSELKHTIQKIAELAGHG
jgi:Fe-S cluster assembly scaffold protein SufB